MFRMHRERLVNKKSTVNFARKIWQISVAWERMRPEVPFGSLTLDQFKVAVKPSIEKRVAIAGARATLSKLIAERRAADLHSARLIQRVVYGVRGSPMDGDDGKLIAAMGYVPHSVKCEKARRVRAAARVGRSK